MPPIPPLIVTLTLNPALDITAAADRVRPTEKVRCTSPRFDPGGGGINVARVAARFGADVLAIFPAGGPAGDLLQELLASETVPSCVVPIACRTRESLVVDERESGLQYRFVFPGPTLSRNEQAKLLERLSSAPRIPAYVVVSGSPPPELPSDFFRRLRETCSKIGARLLLDVPGEALIAASGSGVYLLKPNRSELEIASGRELNDGSDELEAARALIVRGCAEIVVVSLGEHGALLVGGRIEERIAPTQVRVCSAVGAGDSMLAGIAVGLARGFPLRDAVRLGAAAGAAALTTPGTELAHREDVERLFGAQLDDRRSLDPE